MTSFAYTGLLDHEPVRVQWEDGKVTGTHHADAIPGMAEERAPFFIPGYGDLEPDLADHLRASQYIGFVCRNLWELRSVKFEGDEPEGEEGDGADDEALREQLWEWDKDQPRAPNGRWVKAGALLRDSLKQLVDVLKKANPKPDGWKHGSVEEYVQEEGREWTPKDLPAKEEALRGAQGECFKNAADPVLGFDGQPMRPDLRYVEGFAHAKGLEGLPIHHAWLVDADDNVLEVTWPEVGTEYIGIEVPPNRLREAIVRRTMYGALADLFWRGDE